MLGTSSGHKQALRECYIYTEAGARFPPTGSSWFFASRLLLLLVRPYSWVKICLPRLPNPNPLVSD